MRTMVVASFAMFLAGMTSGTLSSYATRSRTDAPTDTNADRSKLSTAGASQDRPAGGLCAGGMQGPVAVEIVPQRTVTSASGEQLSYAVRLHNRSEGTARIRYAVELVTDVGIAVMAPLHSAVVDAAPTAVREEHHSTPVLTDGFYILRVTSASATPNGDSTDVVHLLLEVTGGRLYELDVEDFYARSGANEGVVR